MKIIKTFVSVIATYGGGVNMRQKIKKTAILLGFSVFLLPLSFNAAVAASSDHYFDNMGSGKRLIRDGNTGLMSSATPVTWDGAKWEKVTIDATWFRLKNKKTGKYLNYPTCAAGAAANQKGNTANTNKLKYENSRLISQSCPSYWLSDNLTLENWSGSWAQWDQIPTTGTGTTTHTITLDGQDREFIVYVPETAGTTAPVVFVVHGTGSSGQAFYDDTDWTSKADAEGIIAVFPTSLTYCYYNDGVLDVKTKWAAGALGEQDGFPMCSAADVADLTHAERALIGNNSVADDLAFFDSMFSFLEANHSVDKKRFYVTGNSNGASMTIRLAAERSARFAAAAMNAGGVQLPFSAAERPMSTMLTIGNNDPFLERLVLEERPIEIDEPLIFEPGLYAGLQAQLSVHGLSENYTYAESTQDGVFVARWLFDDSFVGADNSFQFIVIEGRGHSYPNEYIDQYWDFMSWQVLP